jgi:hypothetical protein
VSAFTGLLAAGSNGQLTVSNGIVYGTFPMPMSTSNSGCYETTHQAVVSLSFSASSASGELREEWTVEGPECETPGAPGYQKVADIDAMRIDGARGANELDGGWVVTVTDAVNGAVSSFDLQVNGSRFSAGYDDIDKLAGVVTQTRASASGDNFEFAARKR